MCHPSCYPACRMCMPMPSMLHFPLGVASPNHSRPLSHRVALCATGGGDLSRLKPTRLYSVPYMAIAIYGKYRIVAIHVV